MGMEFINTTATLRCSQKHTRHFAYD